MIVSCDRLKGGIERLVSHLNRDAIIHILPIGRPSGPPRSADFSALETVYSQFTVH
jgi:hypothetical protein